MCSPVSLTIHRGHSRATDWVQKRRPLGRRRLSDIDLFSSWLHEVELESALWPKKCDFKGVSSYTFNNRTGKGPCRWLLQRFAFVTCSSLISWAHLALGVAPFGSSRVASYAPFVQRSQYTKPTGHPQQLSLPLTIHDNTVPVPALASVQ